MQAAGIRGLLSNASRHVGRLQWDLVPEFSAGAKDILEKLKDTNPREWQSAIAMCRGDKRRISVIRALLTKDSNNIYRSVKRKKAGDKIADLIISLKTLNRSAPSTDGAEIRLMYVNPLSVDNLALYDTSLLKGIEDLNQRKAICNLNNVRFDQKLPDGIEMNPIYSYCGRSSIGKVVCYVISQFRVVHHVWIFRPDIIHFQWFRMLATDILLLVFLRLFSPAQG